MPALPRTPRCLLGLALLGLAAACSDAPTVPVTPIAPELVDFRLVAADNAPLTEDVVGMTQGDTIRFVLPTPMSVTALRFRITTDVPGVTATLGGADLTPTTAVDLTESKELVLSSRSGGELRYIVDVVVWTGLPVVSIETLDAAPILDRDNYVSGTVSIYGGKRSPQYSVVSAAMQIRGRGNSTWGAPKKPYRLRLGASASLFGFPADRDYTLLANYWDLSLLRNGLAFEIGRGMTAVQWTPRCQPVELVLNGQHQGSYGLCDHVEVATGRVPATSAGWFLEVTNLPRVDADEFYFRSPALDAWSMQSDPVPSVWVYKQPDPPSEAQRAQVEGDLLRFESVLYGDGFADPDTGYAAYLNVDATIDWYLAQELAKNNDAAFVNSTFVYMAPGAKIVVGPIWDFDLAFGNYPYDAGPTGWKIRNAAWIERLFEDRAFINRLKTRWLMLYARRGELDTWLATRATDLQRSQALNHARWSPYDFPKPLLRAPEFLTSTASPLSVAGLTGTVDYAAEVSAVRTWLAARFAWLHTNIMDL